MDQTQPNAPVAAPLTEHNLTILFVIVGVSLAFTFLALGIEIYRDKHSDFLRHGLFLRIVTVVLIMLTVLILAAINKLNPEAIASITSGVAGYALGGIHRPVKNGSDKNGADGES